MTPIQLLLSLDLNGSAIARRLHVSRATVSGWRNGHYQPTPHHQAVAQVYLQEIHAKISSVAA